MPFSYELLPVLIKAIDDTIENNAEEVTALDQAIGDGDHVTNLQRGIHALIPLGDELGRLDWSDAMQKIGMTLLSSVGGASGSLYGTLFISMSKAAKGRELTAETFAEAFAQGVDAVKRRGRAEAGEKTMLDVLIPVADSMQRAAKNGVPLPELLRLVEDAAVAGVESTRDMIATKGRASFLGERTRGHLDAGAKTAQLMICSVTAVMADRSASPT
ncbi:MAG: dihydroxyacetone kinase subunit DhaL [Gammaproteobacteria bacterium]